MNPLLPEWIAQVKVQGVRRVALAFGVEETRGRGLTPCPACSAAKRHPSRRDRRGAVGVRRDGLGWRCFECEETGDAITLASWCVLGKRRPIGQEWGELRRACAVHGLCFPHSREVAGPRARFMVPIEPQPEPTPVRPRGAAEVWATVLQPVTQDAAVSRYLTDRALDPADIEARDLARALPEGTSLPRWTRFQGRPWTETGHRLIVPLWSATGVLESLHARNVLANVPLRHKAASPAGAELRGLVMADALGRRMLEDSSLGNGSPAAELIASCGLWVMEGLPDFLTRATDFSEAAENAPAVLGILSGSWTGAVAARVPDGTTVGIDTHADSDGDKYADLIANTLVSRCRLKRSREVRAA